MRHDLGEVHAGEAGERLGLCEAPLRRRPRLPSRQPFCAPFSRRMRVSLRVSMSAIPTTLFASGTSPDRSSCERQLESRRGRSRMTRPAAYTAARLGVLGVDAGVADVRIGQRDDLPAVRGIGEDFLIAGHRGVEHHLAHGGARAPIERPRKTVPSARTSAAGSKLAIL